MNVSLGGDDSSQKFFFECSSCGFSYETTLKDFIVNGLSKLLDLDPKKLQDSYQKGNLKLYTNYGVNALQFRKALGKVEAGTMVCFQDQVHIIKGFPKIRRTLMISEALKNHFNDEVAVEEKMNGYNVRIASLDGNIVAFTRGGYICPYTTKKAPEILDLNTFFRDYPQMVICGEMVGTENPYVSHYYPEIGKLGFRIFDIREKSSNQPLPILEKMEILQMYHLPPVRLFGIYNMEEAPPKILELVKKLGEENREGVVIKDPEMKIPPLKYTSSQAQAGELQYAFTFPFDLGKAFLFSRVIREGFQAYEMQESEDELKARAQRIGESIVYPMLETIKHVSDQEVAGEDLTLEVDSQKEAEEFIRHLRDLRVMATLVEYQNGRAVIRRIHQSTTDKIINYLQGGLY